MDRTFEIRKKNQESYKTALEGLSVHEFDLLLSPHESLTTALFSRKVKAKKKIAFHKWWNGIFFSETVRKDLKLPDSLRQMSLLQEHDPSLKKHLHEFRAADLEWRKKNTIWLTPVPEWASPQVEAEISNSELFLKWNLSSKYICLFPGSVWKTKQWTEEGFIGTGKALSDQGYQVLVMGGPGEEELSARVASAIPGSLNLAGQTNLQESLSILAKARLVVTNDSAGQHLAALVQAPTVSIFGPTVLDFGFRPWNTRASVVERQGLACRPCGKHGHQKCPIGTHECMKSIQSKEVLERIDQVLKPDQSL